MGLRMNSVKPKQFLEIGNKPILMHCISAFFFYSKNLNIIITLPSNAIEEWEKLLIKHSFNIKHTIVEGGKTRFQSIKNALKTIETSSLAAIHDGVRPFISSDLIEIGFNTAEKFNSAIPIMPVTESIRVMQNNYPTAIDRNTVFSVQTPQIFNSENIICAYQRDFSPEFTDDASVYEKEFSKIQTYTGIPENIKITTPSDLVIAESLFASLSNNPSFPHLFAENCV